MFHEKFYGTQGYFWGWRCIHCGEIVDQVILENRQCLDSVNKMGEEKK